MALSSCQQDSRHVANFICNNPEFHLKKGGGKWFTSSSPDLMTILPSRRTRIMLQTSPDIISQPVTIIPSFNNVICQPNKNRAFHNFD
jgi:hypothetical protein